jgi:hypothetical protein
MAYQTIQFIQLIIQLFEERLFLIIRHRKKVDLILNTVKVLVMSIIFAKETMGLSLTCAALDSSQKFTPEIMKKT